MKPWRNLLSILFVLTLAVGCGKESVQESDQTPQTKTQASEPKFDLEQVRKDYQGVTLKVLDVSERNKEGRNAIAVTLSVPLDPSVNHQDYFQLNDDKGEPVEGAWTLSKSGKIAWFGNTEPARQYQVQVLAGLTAATGQALDKNVENRILTRDLRPTVSFNTNGAFLTKGLSGGLPVVSVNVNEVNIDFFRIKDDQTQAFLTQLDRYYWRMDALTQFGDLVYSGRYALDAAKNTRTERTIDTGMVEPLKRSGLYLAIMQGAGQYDNQQTLWFTVTDLGLHARFYQGQIDVHVSSLKSGKALKDVEVSLYNGKHNVLKTLRSNTNGLASFTGVGNNVRLITAKTQGQYSIIQTRKPALDLSEFDLGSRGQLPVELFVYAPRDLFRPGEVVDFNGLIRDGDGRKTQAPTLTGNIKRPDGNTVHTFSWQAGELGYYNHSWQIPSDAMVGNWYLEVSGPFAQKVNYHFKVEEFLPERMKLTFNSGDKTRIASTGQSALKVPVKGEYLYGAPGSGNRVSTMVNVTQWRNPIDSLKNYEFGDINSRQGLGYFELEDIALNHLGEGELVVKTNTSENRSPLKVKLISSLYESGGRPVSRTYSALIWPQTQMLGIRSHFDKAEGSEGPKQNSRVKFDIVKASLDGTLHQAKNLEVRLVREDRQYFWVFSNSRGWYYDWSEKEYVEMSRSLDITAGQHNSVAFNVDYGHYRLEVSEPGSGLLSSTRFFAGYDWYARWQDVNDGSAGAHPDKVTMALDKAGYQGGDVAKVKIVPPESGEAIIMVEGDRPLWLKRMHLDKAGTSVEIPIDDKWQQHNLYVTAVVLRAADEQKSISPKRSFGLIHLPLNRQPRKIDIEIDTPDKWLPQQTVEARLNFKGMDDGEKVHVTLAAVDVGVLSISDFKTPDPFEHFFGRRAYTPQSRDVYDSVIELNNAKGARLRFGGDAELNRGGEQPQSHVQIVSLFKTPVEVVDNQAVVSLELPEFNGKLRLMALAFSQDKFGSSEKEVTVATPVVSQINLPRFLAKGDKSTVALDISNLSGSEQNLSVEFNVSGPVTMAEQSIQITVPDKQKQTLIFPVEAVGVSGQAEFELTLKGIEVDGQSSIIKRRWPLGVRPAYPAVTKGRRQALKNGETLLLAERSIADLLPETVQGRMSVSNQVDLNLGTQLEHLLQYPYGCLEQTSSRAFVLTHATLDNQKRFELKPLSDNVRLKYIQEAIERVASLQLKNGGFGLWSNRSPEEHWLTVYVADFLLNAKDMGVDVSWELQSSALSRLREYLARSGRFVDERYSEDRAHYAIAYKAYAAYVLSRVNRARLSTLRKLFDKQLSDAKTGLPMLHLGLALYRMGDRKRGNRGIDLGLKALNSEYERIHYLGDYGSIIRDKALAIHLLIGNGIAVDEATLMAQSLADDLHQANWLSTQERNALFLAGIALAGREDTQWLAELTLKASTVDIKRRQPLLMALDAEKINAAIEIKSLNSAPLFVNTEIVGYGKDKPQPVSEGLSITRQWFSLDGKPIAPEKVKVGDLMIVHLQVAADKRTPDALVVDLLPSGFELENQNLSHAVKLDEFNIDGKNLNELSRYTNIKHMEYRDDCFVAALDVSKHRDANLFYLMRAVTPGTYVIPSPYAEDMYKPQNRAIGETPTAVTIENVSL